MLDLLRLAAKYSLSNTKDERHFLLGAVGVRKDGRIVHARNDAILDTYNRDKPCRFNVYKRFPECHAENRLTRKLDFGATVYVARVRRGDGMLAMARPCVCCSAVLRAFRVKKVFYTIDPIKYGVWLPNEDIDIIYNR
jgi:tRNA(Arg) A34 adenosine deaminase TadA